MSKWTDFSRYGQDNLEILSRTWSRIRCPFFDTKFSNGKLFVEGVSPGPLRALKVLMTEIFNGNEVRRTCVGSYVSP